MKKWLRNAGAVTAVGGVGIYTVYKMTFGRYSEKKEMETQVLQGKQYQPYQECVQKGIAEAGKIPFQRIFIESRDGISLSGRYYHTRDGAPVILFFHGYRGTALRDGNGILLYGKNAGYNMLLVDQRGHGKSGGRAITFGIKERYDCIDWIRYINRRFGEETPIVLAGISMGASTVLMASGMGLPANVKGVLADCPFSEPKEILKEVMKQMKYPVAVTYSAVRMGGKIFGGFDVEEYSPLEAMNHCKIPVLFIHGDEDYLVPSGMSLACYETCCSQDKKHVLVKGAAHGMSFCVDSQRYKKELDEFLQRVLETGEEQCRKQESSQPWEEAIAADAADC